MLSPYSFEASSLYEGMNQGTKRVFDVLNKTFYKYNKNSEPHPTDPVLAEKIRRLEKTPVALPQNLFKHAFPRVKSQVDRDIITALSKTISTTFGPGWDDSV